MSFNSKKTRTARKRHRCGETGLDIEPGMRYVVYSGTCEGGFYSEKMLEPLAELFDRINAECWRRNGEGLQFGSLCEAVFDRLGDRQSINDAEVFVSVFPPHRGEWMRVAIAEARVALASQIS